LVLLCLQTRQLCFILWCFSRFVLYLGYPLVISLVHRPHVWGKLDSFKLQMRVLASVAADETHLVILRKV